MVAAAPIGLFGIDAVELMAVRKPLVGIDVVVVVVDKSGQETDSVIKQLS